MPANSGKASESPHDHDHLETQMVDSCVASDIPGALTRSAIVGLEDGQVYVAVGQVDARSGQTHFLQSKHILVKAGGFLRVRSANSNVFDSSHDILYSFLG